MVAISETYRLQPSSHILLDNVPFPWLYGCMSTFALKTQISPIQRAFIEDELFGLTLQGTVQRSGVYRAGLTESGRKAFQRGLKSKLTKLLEHYRNSVNEQRHCTNIEELANHLSTEYAQVLADGRMKIGHAQKALNLYLKYMWCAGWIPEPPHCPFDRIVLQFVPECKNMLWTKLDSMDDYNLIVKCSKIAAGTQSLSMWELKIYSG